MWKCLNQRLRRLHLLIEFFARCSSTLQADIWHLSNVRVCVWCGDSSIDFIIWLFLHEHTVLPQIRPNLPFFLHVLSPSHHTVSIFPSCSIYRLHPLTSPSTPGSDVSFSLHQDSIFSLLFPFPYAYRGDDSARMYKHTHERKMIKSRDVHGAWTDIQGEPSTYTLYFFFSIEAMDRLQARDENPLHWTFLTFTCIKAVSPTGVNSVTTPVVS